MPPKKTFASFCRDNYAILAFVALLEAGQIFVTKKVVVDVLEQKAAAKEEVAQLRETVKSQWKIIGELKERVSRLEATRP